MDLKEGLEEKIDYVEKRADVNKKDIFSLSQDVRIHDKKYTSLIGDIKSSQISDLKFMKKQVHHLDSWI